MKLGVVMDPINTINPIFDSTLSMLWEAQDRGWPIYYFEPKDLFLRDGKAFGEARLLKVFRDLKNWFNFEEKKLTSLSNLDIILMRKDPPFNEEYLYLTHILECAEREGALVANKPRALRDANEKLVTSLFPSCCVPTLISSKISLLKAFWKEEKDIVCKPLNAMGGRSIFHITPQDPNASVIFEMLTEYETRHVMVQRFISEIKEGDKRILLINGEPVLQGLARIPEEGEWRGNVVAGARPVAKPLTKRDLWICEQVAPYLREHGLYFAGIDVIGNYLTEINVTSPSCIRELDEQCNLNISAQLLDCISRFSS